MHSLDRNALVVARVAGAVVVEVMEGVAEVVEGVVEVEVVEGGGGCVKGVVEVVEGVVEVVEGVVEPMGVAVGIDLTIKQVYSASSLVTQ